MKSKSDNNKTEQEYVCGYDSAMTLRFHNSRTAEKHAFWFLPYLKPGMSLLDCGCGSGSITVGLAKVVAPGQVMGVDASKDEVGRARDLAVEAKISNICFEVDDICQLAISDNSFDALFSHNVLEHIPDPNKAIEEMHRVLKPGGLIGIRDYDAGGVLFAPDDKRIELCYSLINADWEDKGGHPRLARQLGGLLYEAGFIEVKMSASYEVHSDPESRKFLSQMAEGYASESGFVERVTGSGLAKVEDLEAIRKAWQIWQNAPGAFHARSHCEAIGRKP